MEDSNYSDTEVDKVDKVDIVDKVDHYKHKYKKYKNKYLEGVSVCNKVVVEEINSEGSRIDVGAIIDDVQILTTIRHIWASSMIICYGGQKGIHEYIKKMLLMYFDDLIKMHKVYVGFIGKEIIGFVGIIEHKGNFIALLAIDRKLEGNGIEKELLKKAKKNFNGNGNNSDDIKLYVVHPKKCAGNIEGLIVESNEDIFDKTFSGDALFVL